MRPNRLQVTYRRNILLANATVCVLAGIGSWLALLPGHPETVRFTPARTSIDVRQEAELSSSSGPGHQRRPNEMQRDGFLGFVRLDKQFVGTPAVDLLPQPAGDTREPAPSPLDFNPSEESVNLSYEPEAVAADAAYASPSQPEAERWAANLDIDIVSKTDPEYPFVAREADKQGRVSILIYVGEDGKVSAFPEGTTAHNYTIQSREFTVDGRRNRFDYVIALEEPDGWYFSDNLLKVLPSWVFRPEIRNGHTVSDFLIVTYSFCLGGDCLGLQLQSIK